MKNILAIVYSVFNVTVVWLALWISMATAVLTAISIEWVALNVGIMATLTMTAMAICMTIIIGAAITKRIA